MSFPQSSEFRIEKARTDAVVLLTNGSSMAGHFFVAQSSPTSSGPERVAELLNDAEGFVPFELREGRGYVTALYNRDHLVMVAIPGDEVRREPGYDVASAQPVAVTLSNGQRIVGMVRVYLPEGRDRLSDWTRQGDRFRYLWNGASLIPAEPV